MHANRLADERSPYLRQHAHNPVDWYPWGDEALERARREDKPLLVSVGYSACHWCHVMAHECFEDAGIAALMNAHFINVKVDREERPDIDQLYQGVVQLLGRGGGWPLTVFLTPDLRPFFGGTYFPPKPRHGLPAFPSVLESLSDAWAHERERITETAGQFTQGLGELADLEVGGGAGALATDDVVQAARVLRRSVDNANGGFGRGGPKFPTPSALALLARGWRRSGDEKLRQAVTLTLEKMATGGLFDHLGGGFHRYCVDARWQVPHFEKMLYDNALLLRLYAEAWQFAPQPRWLAIAEATVGWLAREMTSPDGAFFAAQDADSDGREGEYFVWRPADFTALLGADDARLAMAHFGVTEAGNFDGGATVLSVAREAASLEPDFGPDVGARLAAVKETLLAARGRRVAPGRDDKVLAGWNGLAIGALAFAARAFQRPDWAAMATRAADFILGAMRRPDGRLRRVFQDGEARIAGMLEDYGHLCQGLVSLYEATGAARFLEAADSLAEVAEADFWDEGRRAWRTAPAEAGALPVTTWTAHDGGAPSGAATLTQALVSLGALTGRPRRLERAEACVTAVAGAMKDNPMAYAHLWLAADAWLDGAAEVTLVGTPVALAALRGVVDGAWLPTLSLHCLEAGSQPPPVAAEVLAERRPSGDAAAWLCRDLACQAPVVSAEALAALLAPLGAR